MRSPLMQTNRVIQTNRPGEPAPPSSYLDLYGLSKRPFGGPVEESAYVLFGSHRRVFEALADHVVNGHGIIMMSGEEGIGKSGMLRAVRDVAVEAGLSVVFLSRPADGRLTMAEVACAIAGHAAEMPEAIQEFLQPPRKVLLIDDADLLPAACIDSLKQISDQKPGGTAVVLSMTTRPIAEPSLAGLIAAARDTLRLPRLTAAEVQQYIERSLWVAGGTTRRLITSDALKRVVALSEGNPGAINRLMDAIFTAGFARGDGMITMKTLTTTTGSTAAKVERSATVGRVVQFAAIGLFLIGASVFLYKGLTETSDRARPVQAPVATVPAEQKAVAAAAPAVVAPVVVRPPQPAPAEALAPDVINALMKRGDQSMTLGDTGAARLLFQRAAQAGNAAAATALAKTYDPDFAAASDKPDAAKAMEWYRKGIALGDPRAAERLKRLERR